VCAVVKLLTSRAVLLLFLLVLADHGPLISTAYNSTTVPPRPIER